MAAPVFDVDMQGLAVRETLAHLEHGVLGGQVARRLEDGIYCYYLRD